MTPQDTATLADAINGLYRTFSVRKPPAPVTGCPCCTSDEDSRRLHATPLRRLSPADLDRFAFEAMTTFGSVVDFKYFLPRLLEIAVGPDRFDSTNVEIVFDKLSYGQWRHWPENERAAVERFLTAFRADTLTRPRPPRSADLALCCVGNVVDNLGPFLHAWTRYRTPAAVRHVADFIDANYDELVETGGLWNAFWGDHRPQMRQAIDWLFSDATGAWLDAAFFEAVDAEVADAVSRAVERRAWARGAMKKPGRLNATPPGDDSPGGVRLTPMGFEPMSPP